MLRPFVPELATISIAEGEEFSRLSPHGCVLTTCRCTDHRLPYQRIDQVPTAATREGEELALRQSH